MVEGLTEKRITRLLQDAQENGGDYKKVSTILWKSFSNPDVLNISFLPAEEEDEEMDGPMASDRNITVDLEAVRRTYKKLFACEVSTITNTLANVMDTYCSTIKRQAGFRTTESLNHVVIIFENPMLHSPEFLEHAFPKFLFMLTSLSFNQKVQLVEWYSNYPVEDLQRLLSFLHQLILIQLFSVEEDTKYNPHGDRGMVGATQAMMIFYVANLLIAKKSGHMRPHSELLLSSVAKPMPEFLQVGTFNDFERLLLKFEVHPSEIVDSPIRPEEFLSEELNNRLNMLADFRRQGRVTEGQHRSFSFLDHPFILTAANKVEKLFFDNQLSMIRERQQTLLNTMLTGMPDLPFLLLRIDRHEVVSDTLAQVSTRTGNCSACTP